MKKLMDFVIPLKMFGAAIFTGLICLYMVSGSLYALVTGEAFEYTIPFIFVLQGLLLSVLISFLWSLLLSDVVIKKWRYFPRLVVFTISLMLLLTISLLTFVAIPTEWAKLWLIVNGIIGVGLIMFSIISELHFKATGKRYTEALKNFQTNI